MLPSQAELYRKLLEFDPDDTLAVAQPFAVRLARENGWTRIYAERVVLEYKRYLLLAATVGRPMTPSEEIDQAWHLHLVYTKSYWKKICGEILNKPIHHNPTQGGADEANKYHRQYEDTLRTYEEVFGEAPPVDIWPSSVKRFGPESEGLRIIPSQVWVISKHAAWQGLTASLALITLTVSVGCAGGWDPFQLAGVQFLWFLIPLLIAALATGRWYRSVSYRTENRESDEWPDLTWEQASYLAGGKHRLASAAVARLFDQKHIAIDEANPALLIPVTQNPELRSPVEQAAWKHLPLDGSRPDALNQLADDVEGSFAGEIHKMTEASWIISPTRARAIAMRSALPLLFVILAFGVPRLITGLSTGRPVAYLVTTLVVATVFMVVMLLNRRTLTQLGESLLKRLRQKHPSSKLSSDARSAHDEASGMDAAMTVALFGTIALAGVQMAGLRQWYPRQSTETGGGCGSGCSSGGGGDGGGGDGGGGGGCGGCGGGGD